MSAAKGWFEPLDPVRGTAPIMGLGFHFGIAVAALIVIIMVIVILTNTTRVPAAPTGAISLDYDARMSSRQSLTAYLSANSIADTTPMVQFQIATANFGGIFTENMNPLSPWIGTVSPDAARLQVAAGARAIVFDIWPDPANPSNPVVCAMVDTNQWGIQTWWRNVGGMTQGVGRYSNWQLLTRNKVDAGTMMSAACDAAFSTQSSQQNNDPFFMILRLHGAMTVAYLNKLGSQVQAALGGHGMAATYGSAGQQKNLCSAPVSEFIAPTSSSGGSSSGGFGFVIVCPEVSPGYNLLPGVNTYAGFVQKLQGTTLGEVANMVEATQSTVWFEPASIGPLTQATLPNCDINTKNPAGLLTPAQAGFCVVQPSIGGQTTDNAPLFKDASFQNCQQTGAQMVAVNLFSRDSNDSVLNSWFDTGLFGTYSFFAPASVKKGT